MLFVCIYIYIFCPLFFSAPIGSLSRWVCVFLFKDPPPPVVRKPGRREPRARRCLDARETTMEDKRREERDGKAGKGAWGGR